MKLQDLVLSPSVFAQGTVVAVGNFDGVHLGHIEIIRAVKKYADEKKLQPVFLTFDPHPMEVLRGMRMKKLVTLGKKLELLRAQGMEHCFCLEFDRELASMDAETFLRHLIQKLNMKMLVLGETSHLGNNREGTPEKLKQILSRYQVDVAVVSAQQLKSQTISSSHIRHQLEMGNVETAAKCLGRYFETEGTVVKGKSLGKTLGSPTLNIASATTMAPARGVYATWAVFDGQKVASVTNIGVRPTFYENSSEEVIEAHLLGATLTNPPEKITIEWVARLREEKKFPSAEALQKQIQLDIAKATEILKHDLGKAS